MSVDIRYKDRWTTNLSLVWITEKCVCFSIIATQGAGNKELSYSAAVSLLCEHREIISRWTLVLTQYEFFCHNKTSYNSFNISPLVHFFWFMWRCCYPCALRISLLTLVGGCEVQGPTEPWGEAGGPPPFQRTVSSQWFPAFSCLLDHTINFTTHRNSSERLQKSNPSFLTFPRRASSTDKHIPPQTEDLALPWSSWWPKLVLAMHTQVMRRAAANKETWEPWRTNLNHSLHAQPETAMEAMYI